MQTRMSNRERPREAPAVGRVMVATDRSETADRAVGWAATLADRYGADLYVVQVVVPSNPAVTQYGAAEATQAGAAAEELQRYAMGLAGQRGRSRVMVDDDPAMAIIRAAEEEAADVLVVGNAGMAGRKEFLLGNVPNRISHNARCTVIIVNTISPDGDVQVIRPRTAIRAGEFPKTEPRLAARGTRIAAVMAKHGVKALFGRPGEDGATGRRAQARHLRSALEELGPTFAKLGQVLSTRPDLLPPEFIEELATLQDNVPPLTEEEVVRVMEQDLALLELFAEKVSDRPGLKQVIDMGAVFEHLSASLHRELDFRQEASNIERMAQVLKSYSRLEVPEVFDGLSTSRLLVMEEIEGIPISKA